MKGNNRNWKRKEAKIGYYRVLLCAHASHINTFMYDMYIAHICGIRGYRVVDYEGSHC